MSEKKYLWENTAEHYGFDFLDIEEKVDDNPIKTKVNSLKFIYKQDFEGKRKVGSKFKAIKNFKKKNKKISLNIINLEGAIAEAIILKTALEILKDEGYKNIIININSLGDKESHKNFKRKLTEFYRENKNFLKPFELKKISSDPFAIYYSKKEYLNELNQSAPTPIDNLSEESYEFFKLLTEFIDSFGIEYTIDSQLTDDKKFFTKSIFKIYAGKTKKDELQEVAIGGRYDDYGSNILKKKKVYAVGLQMNFNHSLKKNENKKNKKTEIKIHLVKIGMNAEIKFLKILEILKKIYLPVNFVVDENKISKQLEKLKPEPEDKLLIFGVKEAKNNVVTLRDIKTSSQIKINIDELDKKILKLLK